MRPNVSDHEQALLAYYGRDPKRCILNTRLPGKGAFVLFTNRCGSNYFVDRLNQLPSLTLDHEPFNATRVINQSDKHGLATFGDYVRHLRAGVDTPVWGAKVGAVQLDMLYRFGLLTAFEAGSHILWLKRKDVVAQAVSLYIATTTQQWTSRHEEKAPPPAYDYQEIAKLMRAIVQQNAGAEMVLAVTGLKVLGLWYEDFIDEPNLHLQRVADFLGEPFEPVSLEDSKFKRQEDPLKKAYADRFIAEARHQMALGDAPYAPGSRLWRRLDQ